MNYRVPLLSLLLISVIAGCSKPAPEFGWYNFYGDKEPAFLRPYERMGKTYRPLKPEDARDYRESGFASWYGDDFHGKLTSNGETYDMHEYTAAHKILPLGVFVRVTNKKNGYESIVRLNDRGPFVDNRIIDLSFSAAKELDMVNDGVIPVEVEVLGFPMFDGEYPRFQKPESLKAASYSIQLGSFKQKENAERFAEKYDNPPRRTRMVEVKKDNNVFYRVMLDEFPTEEDALKYGDILKKQGVEKPVIIGN